MKAVEGVISRGIGFESGRFYHGGHACRASCILQLGEMELRGSLSQSWPHLYL